MKRKPVALSTGQAAGFCLVTGDTILNWIKRHRLPARRTAGGQYRILVDDLRLFMVETGIETDLLDATHDIRRYCWEYCGGDGAAPIRGSSCQDCLVRRARALNCFELRCALASHADDFDVCSMCAFLNEWRIGTGNGGDEHPNAPGASGVCEGV